MGVDGVEPPVFTTREEIYSLPQNTPYLQHTRKVVWVRFELTTFGLRDRRSNQLSYQTVFTYAAFRLRLVVSTRL